ncbi:hypothetical protein O3V59_20160 [Brevibacillus thermoruber]|uniref:Uncharacterized protein n=1 Tax=Brevibacillus thermoruber TaxID=33942 RepID=A0A9X3Z5A8_9BACL|nr:hypothetical protein [Brevibacillus thermoruber]MDA5110658.1 hypothetical protein [Brevibacillus thermoruber]
MFKVGDTVVYILDGARGIVIAVDRDRCHVLWEDTFVSWEQADHLAKMEASSAKNEKNGK